MRTSERASEARSKTDPLLCAGLHRGVISEQPADWF